MDEEIFCESEHKELKKKISSVSEFIHEVNELKKIKVEGSGDLFFRGQKTDRWEVKPSVFRDNCLAFEHDLMQIPLSKSPREFVSMRNDFEIMAKYQHYGMCTRLLDLTTNPLVALYFACQKYEGANCIGTGNERSSNKREFNGVVYCTWEYPVTASDIRIKVISALSQYDLSKENSLSTVLERLVQQNIITEKEKAEWLSQDKYMEFVRIIQNNHYVSPPYSNERLSRQSGMFLLCGCFNFNYINSIAESTVEKSFRDLRDEFKEEIYISEDDKQSILDELDTYNINEATLFPELEYQLNYIKKRRISTGGNTPPEFIKFEFEDIDSEDIPSNIVLIDKLFENEEFTRRITKFLNEKYKFSVDAILESVERCVSITDWSKQRSPLSKLRFEIKRELLARGINRDIATIDAQEIESKIIELATQISRGGLSNGSVLY